MAWPGLLSIVPGNSKSILHEPFLVTFNVRTKKFGIKVGLVNAKEQFDEWTEAEGEDIDVPFYDIKRRQPHSLDEDGAFCMDENFAVLLKERGYIVWCFNSDIRLPKGANLILRRDDRLTDLTKEDYKDIIDAIEWCPDSEDESEAPEVPDA